MPDRLELGFERLVLAARAEARARSHAEVGTHHLLLVAAEREDLFHVLWACGVHEGALERAALTCSTHVEVAGREGLGTPGSPSTEVPLTALALTALDRARGLARDRLQGRPAEWPLLLSLASTGGTAAARTLERAGARREDVARALEEGSGPGGLAARAAANVAKVARLVDEVVAHGFAHGARRILVEHADDSATIVYEKDGAVLRWVSVAPRVVRPLLGELRRRGQPVPDSSERRLAPFTPPSSLRREAGAEGFLDIRFGWAGASASIGLIRDPRDHEGRVPASRENRRLPLGPRLAALDPARSIERDPIERERTEGPTLAPGTIPETLREGAEPWVARSLEALPEAEPEARTRPVLPCAAACPLGHGPMDRVVRGEVAVAVCPECLGTFLPPGALERIVPAIAGAAVSITRRQIRAFLDPPGDRETA